jgi:hypothetical protein
LSASVRKESAKNASAAGSGPLGFGVHAAREAATVTTANRLAIRVADENKVAIEADVKKS